MAQNGSVANAIQPNAYDPGNSFYTNRGLSSGHNGADYGTHGATGVSVPAPLGGKVVTISHKQPILCLLFILYIFGCFFVTNYSIAKETNIPDDLKWSLLKSDSIPPDIAKYNAHPWDLLQDKRFNKAYKNLIKPYKLPRWIRKLYITHGIGENKFCSVNGEMVIKYTGYKSGWADDYIELIYFPNANTFSMMAVESDQRTMYGVQNETTSEIFNNHICKEN